MDRSASHLVLECIRYELGVGSARAVAEARDELSDWPTFLEILRINGLMPLAAGCFDDASGTLCNALRDNAKRVLVMTHELHRVLESLESAGIPAIAVKGPVNAWTLYRDPAHRVFSDLDIVLRPGEVSAARAVLAGCGYELPAGGDLPQRHFTELGLDHARNGVHIDLHWNLTPKNWFASVPDGFGERTRMVSVGGRQVRTLGEADTFRYLCLHGAKHGWSGLNWLVDLCSLILRAPGIAKDANEMTSFGLAAASVIVPAVKVAVPPRILSLAEGIVSKCLAGRGGDETVASRFEFQWKLGGNRISMLRYVTGRAWIRLSRIATLRAI